MNHKDEQAKVYDILKGFSTAMVVTLAGRPGARPMHVAQLQPENGEMWFLAGERGELAEQLRKDAMVLLVFQNDTSSYLSVRGLARVEHNPAKVQELWKEPYQVWFPKGPAHPEIALIAVNLVDAEYWDNRGTNKLEYLFEAAKAYIKGRKPEGIDQDQHAKVGM
jgi:general stress protein 26